MTVLSDKTIKARIANKELVPKGNTENATHCSYEFTAALMVRGDSRKEEPITGSGVVIEPAQLVWIKAREMISMPPDMVGVWIQTQFLARKGLLLLNITLIEPGYEGPLSAVLVNFGKENVPIGPKTKIAKVIFLSLDNKAAKLVKNKDPDGYNTDLMGVATNAPKNFLQLETFLPNIDEKAEKMINAIDDKIKLSVATMTGETKVQLDRELREDMKGFFRKWGFGLFAGFLAGCSAVLILMTTFLPRLAAEYSDIEKLVEKESVVQQAEIIDDMFDLKTQFNDLASEIKSLKKQEQGDSTNTNAVSDADNTDPNS